MHACPWRRGFTAATRLLVASIAGFSACEIPTEMPRWNTRWVIPSDSTSVPVDQLLPAGISVTPGGDAFELALPDVTVARTLPQICAACVALDGLTVPKPPFTVSFGGELALPEGLLSARVIEGGIELRLRHDFPFDPLRPSALTRGYLLLSVFSGSTLLARDSLDGLELALPPGTTVSHTLQLGPGAMSDRLEVGFTLHSPAGDPVTVDVDDGLVLEVPRSVLTVADPRILIAQRTIVSPEILLDLAGIESAVTERVRGGAAQIRIVNPFDITGRFELRVSTPGAEIVKPFEIAPGESDVRIELSDAELRSILGQSEVRLALGGVASSPPAGIQVQPGEEIALEARLEIVVATTRDR